MRPYKTLTFEKDCYIDFYDAPVAISVSGGIDSALLLYFLMKYSKNHIYITTCSNRSRHNRNARAAIDVVSVMSEVTGFNNFTHLIDYTGSSLGNITCTESYKDIVGRALKKLHTESKIFFSYTGNTANPPQEVMSKFVYECGTEFDRDPNTIRDIYEDIAIRPWTNINKRKIAEIAKNEGLTDILLRVSNSCETDKNMKEGHCEQCWWCQERYWAFGRYN